MPATWSDALDVFGDAAQRVRVDRVEVGAAVDKDATLKSDANGKAIAWATSGAKVAIALEAATAADQFIEVLLIPNAA